MTRTLVLACALAAGFVTGADAAAAEVGGSLRIDVQVEFSGHLSSSTVLTPDGKAVLISVRSSEEHISVHSEGWAYMLNLLPKTVPGEPTMVKVDYQIELAEFMTPGDPRSARVTQESGELKLRKGAAAEIEVGRGVGRLLFKVTDHVGKKEG